MKQNWNCFKTPTSRGLSRTLWDYDPLFSSKGDALLMFPTLSFNFSASVPHLFWATPTSIFSTTALPTSSVNIVRSGTWCGRQRNVHRSPADDTMTDHAPIDCRIVSTFTPRASTTPCLHWQAVTWERWERPLRAQMSTGRGDPPVGLLILEIYFLPPGKFIRLYSTIVVQTFP